MRYLRITRRIAWIVVASQCAACSFANAPSGWLDSPREAQRSPYGGWAEVEVRGPAGARYEIRGELIAVGGDSLYVATQFLEVIPRSHVHSMKLFGYESGATEMTAPVLLGTLSTFSHGYYLVFTAPFLWIMGGGVTVASRAKEAVLDSSDVSWPRMAVYARYPQGLPQGIDRGHIQRRLAPQFTR